MPNKKQQKWGEWCASACFYPLVICYIAIEHGPVEIVDLPMNNGGSFHIHHHFTMVRCCFLSSPKVPPVSPSATPWQLRQVLGAIWVWFSGGQMTMKNAHGLTMKHWTSRKMVVYWEKNGKIMLDPWKFGFRLRFQQIWSAEKKGTYSCYYWDWTNQPNGNPMRYHGDFTSNIWGYGVYEFVIDSHVVAISFG